MTNTISLEKYSFIYNNVDIETRELITSIPPYKMDPLTTGFNYLGYCLKPIGYRTNDWNWIISMFQKRISNWDYRMLSLDGRLILVRSVISRLAVYWFALAHIPKSILNYLRCCIFNFLWGSTEGRQKMHLVDWHTISKPHEYGGWNIKNLEWFGMPLRLKSI